LSSALYVDGAKVRLEGVAADPVAAGRPSVTAGNAPLRIAMPDRQ
jgi:hypothetical protein